MVAFLGAAAPVRFAVAQDPGVQVRRIADSLLPRILVAGEPVPTRRLVERMAHYRVPAVSVAVISEGAIAWAEAWGLADVAAQRPATVTTLFQAASISKPFAATTALALVEAGRLDLDAAVNGYLTSWRVPDRSRCSSAARTARGSGPSARTGRSWPSPRWVSGPYGHRQRTLDRVY
jgi:CubicO group peptidase (beta-lactamase class C family)